MSDTGLITAENIGTARITVKSAVRDVKAVIEITVTGFDDIDVEFSAGYDGLLYVGEEVTVTVKGVEALTTGIWSLFQRTRISQPLMITA